MKVITERLFDMICQLAKTGSKEHAARDPADPKGPWRGFTHILAEIEEENARPVDVRELRKLCPATHLILPVEVARILIDATGPADLECGGQQDFKGAGTAAWNVLQRHLKQHALQKDVAPIG